MNFRKKLFISQLLLFFTFILVLFPFIERAVIKIVHQSLRKTSEDLLPLIQSAANENEMIEKLKTQELFIFFRTSLLNDQGQVLYDSHLNRHLGEKFTPFYPTSHPEVVQALKEGKGYYEGHSQIFSNKFAYVAIAFNFHGTKYILRTAFPFTQVQELTHNFEVGFLLLSFIILLFFSAMIWLIFYRLSRPIQQIIQAIKSPALGKEETIPEIVLDASVKEDDDFKKLAQTLNALSARIQSQIKNLMEERNEKEAILESLGEGVIAVDSSMVVRYVNQIGSRMLGIPKHRLIGKLLAPHPEKNQHTLITKCIFLLEMCQEQQMTLTDSLLMEEGRKLYLDLIAAPKASGRGAIIVLQDKSSHYKVLEMGKDFVANASHELRTPITIIRGFAETLQDMPELPPEMIADITDKILRSCQRMETLVKNLLTLADIENLPETRFQNFDLILLIENCKRLLTTVQPSVVINIQKDREAILIAADPDLLELAIMNLLENAAKYSTPPAQITISIEEIEDEVKIVISDQGIGIPAPDLELIFERFYTVNKAHSRRLGGAGLGLSIVKTIVEKHDGTIAVSSTVGQGTSFTLILPIQH
jgi:signal transduction histidine kinase